MLKDRNFSLCNAWIQFFSKGKCSNLPKTYDKMEVTAGQDAMSLNDGSKYSLNLAWGTPPYIIFGNKVYSSSLDMSWSPHQEYFNIEQVIIAYLITHIGHEFEPSLGILLTPSISLQQVRISSNIDLFMKTHISQYTIRRTT